MKSLEKSKDQKNLSKKLINMLDFFSLITLIVI